MVNWVNFGLNVVVSGLCSAAADVICQHIEICFIGHLASENPDEVDDIDAGTKKIQNDTEQPPQAVVHPRHTISGLRTWRFFLSSLPIIILQYPWFEVILPAMVPGNSAGDVVLEVVLDQIWDAAVIPMLIAANTLVRGETLAYFWDRVKKDACPIFLWSKLFSLPLEAFMFAYVPVQYQPIFDVSVNMVVFIIQSFYINRIRATKKPNELPAAQSGEDATTSQEVVGNLQNDDLVEKENQVNVQTTSEKADVN